MKILVCGGREFNDWDFLHDKLYWICFKIGKSPDEITIISGAARGADNLGERFAVKYGTNLERFPANWNKYGKAAGAIRNKQMLEEGNPDLVIAFPGGTGTAHMVRIAEKAGIEVIEVIYDNS